LHSARHARAIAVRRHTRHAQAAAYLIEILPAFSKLHTLGLLYCDFKPDNVIQEGDALKLIDLGGVRRTDDQTSAIYGTVGFQAPELSTLGPTIATSAVRRSVRLPARSGCRYRRHNRPCLPGPPELHPCRRCRTP